MKSNCIVWNRELVMNLINIANEKGLSIPELCHVWAVMVDGQPHKTSYSAIYQAARKHRVMWAFREIGTRTKAKRMRMLDANKTMQIVRLPESTLIEVK